MDILLAGVIGGSAYALIAIGVSLIYGVSNIVNFAHGAVFAVGAMLGWFAAAVLGWPLPVVVLFVLVCTAALGLVINAIAIRPLAGAPPIAALLATFAIGVMLDNASLRLFGPEIRRFPSLLERSNFELFGFRFGWIGVVIIGISVLAVVALAWFVSRTKYGRAIRATSQDRDAAKQMGIPVARVEALSFAIASALGGLAGVFVGMYQSNVSPSMGFMAGVQGFAAATLGGLGSIAGAIVGGLVLGIAEAYGVAWFGDSARQLITFGVLLLVLWVRPGGFLGRIPVVSSEPLTGTFFGSGKPTAVPWWGWLTVGAAGLAFAFTIPDYALRVGALVLIFATFALSVTLVGGNAGQLVLGQAGALAVGAYTSALLVTKLDWSFWATLPVSAVLAAVVTGALTAPVWRLRGHYVSIATLAVGAFVVALALNLDWLTNGASGIAAIPRPEIFGITLSSAPQLFVLALVVFLLAALLVSRLSATHLGRMWSAVREDEIAAASSGINPSVAKSLAFGIGAGIAGIAGALYSVQTTYLEPAQFGISLSVLALTIAVLGGLRAPIGALIGALILVAIPEAFRALADWRLFFYGAVLLLLILFRPQGLWSRVPAVDRAIAAIRRRRSTGVGSAP